MGILCTLGQHQASPQVRRNGPLSFGRCRGCGCDLILAASGWRPVPKGYRVVWQSAPPVRRADPGQLALELPATVELPQSAQRIARAPAPPLPPAGPRFVRSTCRAGREHQTA